MSVALSDGTTAKSVHLSMPTVRHGAAAVGDSLWMLTKGAPTVAVRNVRTGEMTSKIDLLEEGVAIATVGPRIWIATVSNKVFVFGADGALLGALQSAGLPLIRRFFVLAPDIVFSCGGGKDFVRWDTTQFSVERTFYGGQPGEVVEDIVAANSAASSIITATSKAIRCFATSDGSLMSEIHEGAIALCVVHQAQVDRGASVIRMQADGTLTREDETGGDDPISVWAAQTGWVTVFSLGRTTKASTFVRERTVPCAGVKQLARVSQNRVCTFDAEGLVTMWDANEYSPLRSFKTTGAVGVASAATSFNCLAAFVTSAVLWTVGDGKALVWSEELVKEGAESVGGSDYIKDLERDEIQFLRRKQSYFDSIMKLFREKTDALFESTSGSGASGSSPTGPAARQALMNMTSQFKEVNTLYDNAVSAWERENAAHEPLPAHGKPRRVQGGAGADGNDNVLSQDDDFTEYWKQRHAEVTAELDKAKAENDSLLGLLHDQQEAGSDVEVRRAHHICQVIKEKNDLRERERQLSEDVAKLRSRLREFNSPLASTGPLEDAEALKEQNRALREEVAALREQLKKSDDANSEVTSALKHNQILKSRVKKLRTDLDDAHRDLAEANATNQLDIERLVTQVSQLQTEADRQRAFARQAEEARAKALLDVSHHQTQVEKYRAMIDNAERELSQREAVERAAHSEVRNEITMLCESLDDRDKRIAEARQQLDDMTKQLRESHLEAEAATAKVESLNAEMEVHKAHIAQLEEVASDRKQYARTVGELQGRLEMSIEELRRCFTPVQFAESVGQLESRMASLCALEAQLRQKDDIIAMRDDQILLLQKHMARVETQMSQVSSVFLHLPKSVEEIELLMVEVDEYRRRLGVDPEAQEMIQIRLLELQAKRRAGEPVPLLEDLVPKDAAQPGKSAADIERLKALGDTMRSLSAAAAKEDKTGLVRPQPSVPAKDDKPAEAAAPAPAAKPAAKAAPGKAAPAKAAPTAAADPAPRMRSKTVAGGAAPPAQAAAKKWPR